MNNEDMSEIIQKLSSMMNNSNNTNNSNSENSNIDMSSNSNETSSNTLQDMLSNMNFNSENNENSNNNQDNNNSNNSFNLDFETIMKMKTVMDSFYSAKNSPEANLLLSLKPYLNNNRKQKLDQDMQFLNISKVIEAFNSNNGGVNKK